jgi:ribonuclease-3
MPEGSLSKMRASIVCESSLAICAHKVGLDQLIMLGSGENSSGGRKRPSILADCFEAVIGAIYLDGGLEAARKFIINIMQDLIADSVNKFENFDYKTSLQEMSQKGSLPFPSYEVTNVDGPDHNRTFTVKVTIGTDMYGTGVGRSKKEAEQRAAKDLLDKDYIK